MVNKIEDLSEDTFETYTQYIQNEHLLGNIAELDDLLCELLETNSANTYKLRSTLQFIYNLLLEYNIQQVNFGEKLFHKFVSLLEQLDNRRMVANVLTCIQVFIKKFSKDYGKPLIEQLWCLCIETKNSPHRAQILVLFFDDFSSYMPKEKYLEQLLLVIRELLMSESRDERKSAYFLMRKLVDSSIDDETLLQWGWSDKTQLTRSWTAYVAILETLEENQSHLVLPSLRLLHSIGNKHENWQSWLNLLYARLLSQNNILVLRWILEYFLVNFKCEEFSVTLLQHFLQAANNTGLYNVEGYHLPKDHVEKFLATADLCIFFEALSTIKWYSVPLHFWLNQVKFIPSFKKNGIHSTKDLLGRVAKCVRGLQNPEIRYASNCLIYELFDKTILNLNIREYVVFVDTLHNISDYYHDHKNFLQKLESSEDISVEISNTPKRFYDIFSNQYRIRSDSLPFVSYYSQKVHSFLAEKLLNIPIELHSWFRFVLVFDAGQSSHILEFCRNAYDLDLKALTEINSISELELIISTKLLCKTVEEKELVHKKCLDFIMEHRIHTWNELEVLHLDAVEILNPSSLVTFFKLCELLSTHNSRVSDEILVALLREMKKYFRYIDMIYTPVGQILDYANSQMTSDEIQKLALDILSYNRSELVLAVIDAVPIPKDVRIRGLLISDPAKGDARIENAYEELNLHQVPNVIKMRMNYQFFHKDKNIIEVFDELLRLNNELTLKKPRYYEHSMEHRLKIRMVYAMLHIQHEHNTKYWSDDLWQAVFATNNQLNISYLYEMLIVRCASNLETILLKLRQIAEHTPSQQNSLISIVYNYCKQKWENWETATLMEIIQILLPLTMGANFQTRLLAQIVIYDLITESEKHEIDIPIGAIVKTSIEHTLGDKLTDYMSKEIRLKFPKFNKRSDMNTPDLILFVTNAPFDEAAHWCLRNGFDCDFQSEIYAAQTLFKNKSKKTLANDQTSLDLECNDVTVNVQRKMNPLTDILPPSDLNSLMKSKKSTAKIRSMFVVASLLEKLPNLGGIARTCEVLGIKNLVIASKKYVEREDFKNLSMTAEKSLNITEVNRIDLTRFLIEKQTEGFKIVGAEQTSNSVNFVDFKFPAKCVLLLGHEKHGIPADLLGFLDYAVEIPQFGEVRSLNVHVTGALFMWEYCKQHKVKILSDST